MDTIINNFHSPVLTTFVIDNDNLFIIYKKRKEILVDYYYKLNYLSTYDKYTIENKGIFSPIYDYLTLP
jgi:hypothetical protein